MGDLSATESDEEVTGVVLAGGESRRFGDRDKLLEPVGGRPLVARVVETVASVTSTPPVIAAGRSDRCASLRAAIDDKIDVVFAADHPAFAGPLAGILGALTSVEAEWLVVVAGDLPGLSTAALGSLIARRRWGTDAIIPVRGGVPEPLHAVYRRRALDRAADDVQETDGPRALAHHLAWTEVRVSRARGALSRSLFDVDTRAELKQYARRRPSAVGHNR